MKSLETNTTSKDWFHAIQPSPHSMKWCSGMDCDRLVKHTVNCKNCPEDARKEVIEFDSICNERNAEISEVTKKRLQTKFDRAVTQMLAANALPLSLVDSSDFKSIVKEFAPKVKAPTRKKLTKVVLADLAKEITDQVKKRIESSPSHSLTIELDGWSSKGLSLLGIVCTDHKGGSILLDLVDISSISHTAANLREIVKQTLTRTCLKRLQVNAIITDEASNFKRARKEIAMHVSKEIFTYRCMAHLVNLVGASMSKATAVHAHLQKLIDLARIISGNKVLVAHLKSQNARKVGLIVPTRWFSTSNCLNSVLALREALSCVPRTETYGFSKWKDLVLDPDFWRSLQDLRPYFDQMSSVIGLAERHDSKLSNSFRAYLDYGRWLFKESAAENPFRAVALEAFLKYFIELDLPLLASAYMLDPNHKFEFLTPICMKEARAFMAGILVAMGYNDASIKLLVEEFKVYKTKISNNSSFITDTYKWWNGQEEFTVLKELGKRFACCHSSSANTERFFSGLNRILTPSRNRLSVETMFNIMTVRQRIDSKSSEEEKSIFYQQSSC